MRRVSIVCAVLWGSGLCATVASANTIADATVLRLDVYTTVQDTVGGAIYTRTDMQPTGTGVLQPFLRIQHNGTESGYNTDGSAQFNTKDAAGSNWDHAILSTDVRLVSFTYAGEEDLYREFILDINESASQKGRYLTLNELQIYISDQPTLSDFNPDTHTFLKPPGNHTALVYELEGQDIRLNYALESGSGSGDMRALIPNSLFVTQARALGLNNPYVYLYSFFGLPDSSDAGFEEWASVTGNNPPLVPLPTTASAALAMLGVLAAGAFVRARFKQALD